MYLLCYILYLYNFNSVLSGEQSEFIATASVILHLVGIAFSIGMWNPLYFVIYPTHIFGFIGGLALVGRFWGKFFRVIFVWPKIQILARNRNIGQISKSSPKI